MSLCSASLFAAVLVLLSVGTSADAQVSPAKETQLTCRAGAGYEGRYAAADGYVIYLTRERYGLSVRPAHWSAKQLLVPGKSQDALVVADNPQRGAAFTRDAAGCIAGVTLEGFDGGTHELVPAGSQPLAIELLLAGKGREAVTAYAALGIRDAATHAALAQRLLSQQAGYGAEVAAFVEALLAGQPPNPALWALLGEARVAAGDRAAARAAFDSALRVDPAHADAISGMFMLDSSQAVSSDGWRLPFSLDDVFRVPSAQEIQAVREDWATRDLQPRNVKDVATGTMDLGFGRARVRIVSHDVHGQPHIGAIVVPEVLGSGCCAVVMQMRGVSWSYDPLPVDRGIPAATALGSLQNQAIYVIPGFRGETLEFAGTPYKSGGIPSDALDGATDDAIALLSVALATTPQADAKRICAYGHSRGGSVGLLMGIRDKRVGCVVDMAGPADWFELMAGGGWTQKELAAEGLRIRAKPNQTAGQFLERFLIPAVEGRWNLRTVRHRMIASSPLYFVSGLPRTQLHYGVKDPSVPEGNGRALVRALEALDGDAPRFEAYFYPGAGHDTDRLAAPVLSSQFLAESLMLKR